MEEYIKSQLAATNLLRMLVAYFDLWAFDLWA